MNDLDRCYRLLGLEPGASIEEVNQAYKDLAFIWHPDRIPKDNLRLHQKAQDKLKEINHAREVLRGVKSRDRIPTTQSTQKKPSSPPSYYQSAQQKKPSSPDYYQSTQQKKPSPPPPPPPSYYQPPSRHKSHYESYSQPKKPYGDLSGVDLRGANLQEKDFSYRNLSKANLSEANLSDAFMHKVNLQQADLSRANLFRANLLQANLSHANLRESNLIGADFSGADLSGADLSGAKVGAGDRIMVKLTGANLRGTIMPDGSIHQ